MKRIGTFCLALLFLIMLAGCVPEPTNPPATTPVVTPVPAATPDLSPIIPPDATSGVTPDATTPGTSPGVSPGDMTGSALIPNFKEGTVVTMTDIPEIQSAFEQKYKDHTVVGIRHALRDSTQLYAIEYKDQAGATQEVFIYPNGTWYDMATPPSTTP